jgi:hypothetical protein
MKPTQVSPAPPSQRTSTVPPAATPPVTKSGPLPSAAAVPAQPAPGGAVPAAKKPGDPATAAARKKNSRRNPSSAYLSPGDVSPFSLPGMGSR